MNKIEKMDERLTNKDNSDFLQEKKMKEDEKKRKVQEAFELKE